MSLPKSATFHLRYEQCAYWRNRGRGIFTFVFPLMFLVSLTEAGVEVIDDGVGAATRRTARAPRRRRTARARHAVRAGSASAAGARSRNGVATVGKHPGRGGHGLPGLAERARLLNGTIEAGALAGGGYRLAVIVPVPHA